MGPTTLDLRECSIMASIDIFYQGEGIRDIEHLEIDPDQKFGAVKAEIARKHALTGELLLFLEDGDELVDHELSLRKHAGRTGIKLHLHRCRHVEVAVTFNNETVRDRFSPAATMAKIKKWAAQRKFGMSDEEAGEHVLQIAGTHDRPAAGAHIGTLVSCSACRIAFDLVPDERINGAAGACGAAA